MDTSGNIRWLGEDEKPKDNEIPLEKPPNPNCPDCYGRGHIRRILENVVKIEPCHCTKKRDLFANVPHIKYEDRRKFKP